LITLALAPWVIHAFYAKDFTPAISVLQWQVLGVFGRVVSRPLGYLFLAKGS
jgi:antigen flippase